MITVAGLAPSLDITYVVEDLRLGRIHRPRQTVRCAGGKPLNCARVARRLGAEVAVVALLGGPTGDALRAGLVAEGLEVATVPTPVESRTCVSIASDSTGALTEVYPYADPVPEEVWASFRHQLTATTRRRPGWLVVCGAAPRDLPPQALAELVRIGHDAGCRVAVDTHGAALPAAAAARPELLKINRHEAVELLGRRAEPVLAHQPVGTDLGVLVSRLHERFGGTVVITDAEHGALARDDHGAVWADLPDIRGHYPVGSGDSFLAGLLTVLDAGGDLSTAMVTATAAGAANALEPGPGHFDAEVAHTLAPAVRLRPWAQSEKSS